MSEEANKWRDNRRTFGYEVVGSFGGNAYAWANCQEQRRARAIVGEYAEDQKATADDLAHAFGAREWEIRQARYYAICAGFLTKSAGGFAVTAEGKKVLADG